MKSIKKRIFSNKKSKKHIGGSHLPIDLTSSTNPYTYPDLKQIVLKQGLRNHYKYKKQTADFSLFITDLKTHYNTLSPPSKKLEIKIHGEALSPPPLNTVIQYDQKKTVNIEVISGYDYEDANSDKHIYVSYSNKYLGGGFLTHGFSQEEIIFYEFFDLFLTVYNLLITREIKMGDNQVIIIKNARRLFKCNVYGVTEFEELEKPFSEDEDEDLGKFSKLEETDILVDFLAIDGKPRSENYFNDLKFMFNKAYIGFKTALDEGYKHIHIGDWIIGDSVTNNKLGHNPSVMYYLQILALTVINPLDTQINIIYHIDNKGIQDKFYEEGAYIETAKKLLKENLTKKFNLERHIVFLYELDKKLNEQMKIYVPFKTLLDKKLIKIEDIVTHLKKTLKPK
jgi:hypothetical protein